MNGPTPADPSGDVPPARHYAVAEILLIFGVFFLQGAWPAPDVNEPYYLGKAIHYWNRDWVQGDFFLQSKDAHAVFYVTFGWLSLWLSAEAMAWTGRVVTWLLLAWSWRRLSWAMVPRRWFAVLSGALFACLVERCHMSGEWIIGGVEAKGFAYVLVLLGLEALVRDRWNRAWLLLGGASLLHVLAGGWAVVAAAFAWLWLGRQCPPLRAMGPGVAGAALCILPSLVISLRLDWGTEPEVVRRAHEIYVYYRLPHHLLLQERKPEFFVRFAMLIVGWAVLCYASGKEGPQRRLRAFVVGALAIAVIGAMLSLASVFQPTLVAGLLRYYWFRLADVAVPMGMALGGVAAIDRLLASRPGLGKLGMAAALIVAALHVGDCALQRCKPVVPRADAKVDRLGGYESWGEACQWVAASGVIPKDARFLTPIDSSTFKWRAQRPEVATRKEIPQDAESIVRWWDRLRDIHGIPSEDATKRFWHGSLSELGADRLTELGKKYAAEYVLTEAPGRTLPPTPVREAIVVPRLPLKVVYENAGYVIYQLRDRRQP